METYELLEKNILQIADGKVLEKKQSRLSSFILIPLGLVLAILNTNLYFDLIGNATLKTSLFFVGLVLFVWGLIALFVKKEQYIYAKTGKKLIKYTLEFDSKEFDKITRLYDNDRFQEIATLKKNSQASGLVLKLIGTKSGDIYLSQVLKYIPYTFVPTGQGKIHEGRTAEEIKELIVSYNKTNN